MPVLQPGYCRLTESDLRTELSLTHSPALPQRKDAIAIVHADQYADNASTRQPFPTRRCTKCIKVRDTVDDMPSGRTTVDLIPIEESYLELLRKR